MDPIIEDDIKRSRRLKQYAEYQTHLDEAERREEKKDTHCTGTLHGKEVKKIEAKEKPSIVILFSKTVEKK